MRVDVPRCGCSLGQEGGEHADRELPRQIALLFSRRDEQQRRWFAAVEATRIGRGGEGVVSRITGLAAATIQRGREGLAASLVERPPDRARLPGGGRPPAEKKIRRARRP